MILTFSQIALDCVVVEDGVVYGLVTSFVVDLDVS
jgi:hypothetical protein